MPEKGKRLSRKEGGSLLGGNAHSERTYGEVRSLAPHFELLYEIVAKLTDTSAK